MASYRLEWAVLMLVIMKITFVVSQESGEKISICSCVFQNGSIVTLWPVDGGSKPSFTGIDSQESRTFDWNPCTPFSESSTTTAGCNDVCQLAGSDRNPAGSKNTSFSVDSSGNVVILYGGVTDSGTPPYTRETRITLKCDPNEPGKGTIPSFTETCVSSVTSLYSGTLTSKYACVGAHSFSMAI